MFRNNKLRGTNYLWKQPGYEFNVYNVFFSHLELYKGFFRCFSTLYPSHLTTRCVNIFLEIF